VGLFKSNKSNFITQTEALINMCSGKRIPIKPAQQAYTDGKTIYLPWLPDNATDEQFLKFFCHAGHEQSHFHGESDVKSLSKGSKLRASMINCVEDIRCERKQEVEYPGWRQYRLPYYENTMKDFGYGLLKGASKKDMPGFIHAMSCKAILKARQKDVNFQADLDVNPELDKAYDKYLLDLEPIIDAMDTYQDAENLGELIFNRVRDLIKDNEQEKMPPPPKQKQQQQPQDTDEGDDEEQQGGGSGEDNNEEDKDDQDNNEDDNSTDESTDGNGSEGDTGEEQDEDDSDSGSGNNQQPQEFEGDQDEWDKELEDRASTGMEELEDHADEIKTLDEQAVEDINKLARDNDSYRVSSNVKDNVGYNDCTQRIDPQALKEAGFKIIGSAGSRMTRLFVSQTRPRNLRNQWDGRFDARSFVQDTLDRRMNVFANKQAASLDKAAVSFVMDNSGSMSRVIQPAYAMLSGLMYHLCKANIPCEASGFTGPTCYSDQYRDVSVTISIIKKFEDAYDRKTLERCRPPLYMDLTPDLDGIMWAAPRLFARPEKKKVMFIITDGKSYLGSITSRLHTSYIRYIQRLKELGIYVFGFGIDSTGMLDLSEVFGDDYFVVTGHNMGTEILAKLTSVLNNKQAVRRAA